MPALSDIEFRDQVVCHTIQGIVGPYYQRLSESPVDALSPQRQYQSTDRDRIVNFAFNLAEAALAARQKLAGKVS